MVIVNKHYMKEEIKILESLGASITVLKDGLRLNGDWKDEYNPHHLLFIEITGYLSISNAIQDKDFLKNLKCLGQLYTSYVKQDKDFLNNLTWLGHLYTSYTKQHKYFLKNLKCLGYLDTYNAKQHKDFLNNLTSLGRLDTYNAIQHKDFLKNLKCLGQLSTYYVTQDKDFLKDVSYDFDKPYLYVDKILSIILNEKEFKGYTVYETNRVGYTDTEYVITDGQNYSHGKSIKKALLDLRYKTSDRDLTDLKELTLNSVLSFEDCLLTYRRITGACMLGIENFISNVEEKEYSIKEIIEETENQYGNEMFKEFFN